jgi:hypothetical protein
VTNSNEPTPATPSGPGASRPEPHALGRLGRLIGRLIGSTGRRAGARDTDPGR